MKTLSGDGSDEIPGLKFGRKKVDIKRKDAYRMIVENDLRTLDAFLEHIDGRIGSDPFFKNREMLEKNWKLVGFLPIKEEDLIVETGVDEKKARQFLEDRKITSVSFWNGYAMEDEEHEEDDSTSWTEDDLGI